MRIAHAIEHFDESETGFVHALALAAHSGEAELVTLHVTQGREETREPPSAAALLARWSRPAGCVTQRVHECPGHDEVADELIAACEALQPALLVMATHARSGMARVFAGSVAEAVARNVRVPSLLLPLGAPGLVRGQDGALALSRMLVLGGSEADTQLGVDAAAWLGALLRSAELQLSVLHVDDGTQAPHPRAPQNVTLTQEVRQGSLEDAVQATIRERDPQLLVMVSHGHDQLRDVLWSSHTERVLHVSRRPLLWVPPGFAPAKRA